MDERHAFRLLDPETGEQVLDLGCGTGRYLTKLGVAGTAPPVGVFSLGMLRVARRRAALGHLVCAELQRDLPFAGCTFDATLCALVGEHLETDLAELVPGAGRLIGTNVLLALRARRPA